MPGASARIERIAAEVAAAHTATDPAAVAGIAVVHHTEAVRLCILNSAMSAAIHHIVDRSAAVDKLVVDSRPVAAHTGPDSGRNLEQLPGAYI